NDLASLHSQAPNGAAVPLSIRSLLDRVGLGWPQLDSFPARERSLHSLVGVHLANTCISPRKRVPSEPIAGSRPVRPAARRRNGPFSSDVGRLWCDAATLGGIVGSVPSARSRIPCAIESDRWTMWPAPRVPPRLPSPAQICYWPHRVEPLQSGATYRLGV